LCEKEAVALNAGEGDLVNISRWPLEERKRRRGNGTEKDYQGWKKKKK